MPQRDSKQTRSRSVNRLSARAVETVTAAGVYMDGGGLMLRVTENGRKTWLLRFTSPLTGKRREMGLGTADRVSLKVARDAAQAARETVARGLDPIEEAEREKLERRAEAAKGRPLTFGEFADEWLAEKEAAFHNPKHRAQWHMTLRKYAGPLRDKRPGEITTEHVLGVLKPLWQRVPETAKRTQGRIENVLDAARARGLCSGENPARWRGHLAKILPARGKRAKSHHPAMQYDKIPAFMSALRERSGVAARALEFLILTAARSGEVRGMTWGEVDLDRTRWTVPAARMKAGNEHRVPLCKRAVAILAEMALLRPEGDDGRALVFPGDATSGKRKPGVTGPVQMSDMTLAAVLKRMGRTDVTVHGFRSTFQDWAEEQARYPASAVEAALAHVIGGTRASYRRGDSYDMRQELMAVWDAYLSSATAREANVVPMRRA